MAAKTPDTVTQESMGSLNLHICNFKTTDIDDGDSWTSYIPGIVSVWGQLTNSPGAVSDTGLTVSVSNFATGQIYFYTGPDNRNADIYVMSKS